MSTKIACTNPAHGVKSHIVGTLAARDCQRASGQGPSGNVPQAVPSSASGHHARHVTGRSNDPTVPWQDLTEREETARAISKTALAADLVNTRLPGLNTFDDPTGGVGPYISTGLGPGQDEVYTEKDDIVEFTAAPDLEPNGDHGKWTLSTNQDTGISLTAEDLDIDSDPEKVADWVVDNLRDWRVDRAARVASELDDSNNWEGDDNYRGVTGEFQKNFRTGIQGAGLECDAPDGSGSTYIYLSTGHTLATGMEDFESAQMHDADGEEVDDLHFPEMKDVRTAEDAVRHWASFAVEAEKSLREGTYQKQV